jgi:hypothetical protein
MGGHAAVVEQLLNAPGVLLDQPTAGKGGFHLTPLHIAAQAGSAAAARVLVRAGACTGARDVRGRTPATLARDYAGNAALAVELSP